MNTNKFNVYQIFYDEASRRTLDPGFIPLDNSSNTRPDWYEFWVILEFLKNNPLKEGQWYGFLSPKFRLKTGLTSANVYEFLGAVDAENYDIAIVSPGWDQAAYYLNPFEQGEVVHPGIIDLTQSFFHEVGINVDLRKMVCDSNSTVFCNFIIAKPQYWKAWQQLAQKFFDFVENNQNPVAEKMAQDTYYPSPSMLAPMKTFIQERFPSVLFQDAEFKTANLNVSEHFPIFERLFDVDLYTRGQLQTCDSLKQQYLQTGDHRFLDAYYAVRSLVSTKF